MLFFCFPPSFPMVFWDIECQKVTWKFVKVRDKKTKNVGSAAPEPQRFLLSSQFKYDGTNVISFTAISNLLFDVLSAFKCSFIWIFYELNMLSIVSHVCNKPILPHNFFHFAEYHWIDNIVVIAAIFAYCMHSIFAQILCMTAIIMHRYIPIRCWDVHYFYSIVSDINMIVHWDDSYVLQSHPWNLGDKQKSFVK